MRDYLEPTRSRHADARALFDLAAEGLVELAAAPSGYLFEVGQDDLAVQIREMLTTQGVKNAGQLAYPGRMFPGATYPGAGVPELAEAWNAIASDWRTNEGKLPGHDDRAHVETHVMEKRDVFVTDDRALLAMCRRLRDEHGFPIEAIRLSDYIAEHT